VGKGIDEVGVVVGVSGKLSPNVKVGQKIIRVHPRYFRPTEVESLLGDSYKAKKDLGWKSEITVQEMCKEMIEEDYKVASRAVLLKENKLDLPNSIED
jgi:GDPmannose 4,6-dehydratase